MNGEEIKSWPYIDYCGGSSMFDLIVNLILLVLFIVFLISEVQQWGVPQHLKKLPLTYFEKE